MEVEENPQGTTVINVGIERQLGTFGEVTVNFMVIFSLKSFFNSFSEKGCKALAPIIEQYYEKTCFLSMQEYKGTDEMHDCADGSASLFSAVYIVESL